MEVLFADINGINHALAILRGGGVIAHATETCYGLACDLRNPDAVLKLFNIKQRPLDQPVSALFSSLDEAKKYVEWNDEAQKLADEYLPGPLTIIVSLQKNSPLQMTASPETPLDSARDRLHPKPETAGVRISSHPLAQQLVHDFGSPLSTTSANLHGHPNSYSAEDIVRQFEGQEFQPDLILDSGSLEKTPPSTVVDLSGKTSISLKRKGGISLP